MDLYVDKMTNSTVVDYHNGKQVTYQLQEEVRARWGQGGVIGAGWVWEPDGHTPLLTASVACASAIAAGLHTAGIANRDSSCACCADMQHHQSARIRQAGQQAHVTRCLCAGALARTG